MSTRYDANPGFRKGQILKTLKGSELALLRIETHPTDPDYVDKVVFKIRRIHPKDLEPIGRHPGLMAQQYWSYPKPKVGDEFELVNQDLNLVKWPRVDYQPTFHAAASRVAAKFKKKKQVDKADGSGKTTVYEYSKGQVDHRNREKAKRIQKLKGNILDLRKQYKSDLKSDDPEVRLTALAVALMDETCERVGNDQSVKDRGHFGVTTLQAKHVKITGSKATLTYTGKSGVDQKKTVADHATVSALKKALKGKSGTDTVLCEGDDCIVKAEDVNKYLKKYDITAKDIRGFRANDEMVRQLKEQRKKGKTLPTDRKEKDEILKAEFTKALEATAEVVGHESSTLRSQYLVPKMEDSYIHDGTVMEKWDKKATPSLVAEALVMTYYEFESRIDYNEAHGLGNTAELWMAWQRFYAIGRKWLEHVIDKKAIPARRAKGVEMLARLFSVRYGRGKGPRQGYDKWYRTNKKRWPLLIDSIKWKDRSSEGGGIWTVGPFTVHDTVGADEAERARISQILEKAVRKSKRGTGLPRFARTLYGDVYIVGKIGRPNWAAWYMPSKDAVYFRVSGKGISEVSAVQNLIHELTHRYKNKFLDKAIWQRWRQYHSDLSTKRVETKLPEVGEVLPMQVNNKEVMVSEYGSNGGAAHLVDIATKKEIGTVERMTLFGWFKKSENKLKFPSIYAASDAEEHLCEAASMRATKTLPKEHKEWFEKVIKGEYENFAVSRTAGQAVYSGVFLSDSQALLRWWTKNVGPLHPTVKAHHMTIKFGPTDKEIMDLPVGASIALKVVGYGADEHGQAVVVQPRGIQRQDKGVAHITVAVNGVSPAYSNKLLGRGYTKINGPVLRGQVGFLARRQGEVLDPGMVEQVVNRRLRASGRKELHLFDFDGTLFRSPHKPSWWDQKGWWGNQLSLSPPCVPLAPGKEWWDGKTVAEAKRSIGNPNVWAICCTGRMDGRFRWRVPELLKSAGLNFDEVYLNKGGDTSSYKKKVIHQLHVKHGFDVVHVWEDQHMSIFQSFVEKMGVTFVAHPQTEHPHEVECSPEDVATIQ